MVSFYTGVTPPCSLQKEGLRVCWCRTDAEETK